MKNVQLGKMHKIRHMILGEHTTIMFLNSCLSLQNLGRGSLLIVWITSSSSSNNKLCYINVMHTFSGWEEESWSMLHKSKTRCATWRKPKKLIQYYMLQQILEMRRMYSTPLNSLKFSTNSIQQTQLHTQLHAKGDPRNNLDTLEQH